MNSEIWLSLGVVAVSVIFGVIATVLAERGRTDGAPFTGLTISIFWPVLFIMGLLLFPFWLASWITRNWFKY